MTKLDYYWLSLMVLAAPRLHDIAYHILLVITLVLVIVGEYRAYLERKLKKTESEE